MSPTAAPEPEPVTVDDPSALERAAAVLRAGGSVVLPTDTVYGLAALPTVPGATDQLFDLKVRAADQPFAVLVADADQASSLVDLDPDRQAVVDRWTATFWPGPLTVVARRSAAALALQLGIGPDTIGVRCPDHAFVRALAAEVGPIATTSANRSGQPTPVDARAAAAALSGPVGLVVDGGPAGTLASTVVDVVASPWRVLRVGVIAADRLAALAEGPVG